MILCVALLFASCAPAPAPADIQPSYSQIPDQPQAEEPESEPESESEPEPEELINTVYEPKAGITAEELVKAYFEQHYLAYANLIYIDISSLINTESPALSNMLKWSEYLIQRRRLLYESGMCYVETEMLPYTIEFDEKPEDERMERWREWLDENGDGALHFRIRGEPGRAYPPIMALNSQHTMFFQEIDGEQKIAMHYFPGSVRKFTRAGEIEIPNEDEMLKSLEDEFGWRDTDIPEAPPNTLAYDGGLASGYALSYAENRNPDFYGIIDWIGNCANFVSQCVWAGFGGENAMTVEWSGGDGGTPAWENVNHFWSYITGENALRGQRLENVGELREGDIIQTRTATIKAEPERFTHMMIVADEDTLLLAQNSPDCFVYYSDLVNVEARLVRPVYLVK